MENLKEIVVIYHGNCKDGLGAAYSAWKKFGEQATYIPWRDHDTLPEGLTDKELYIVDFGFSLANTEKLIAENKSVVVIDHHKSAEEIVTAFPDNVFDLEHSGAVLAWKYFHPDTKVPELLLYVEDHDIWKFKMPHTREFGAALGEYEMNFETWDKLNQNLCDRDHFSKFISHGAVIAGFEDKLVDKILQYREKVVFEGQEIYVLNADRTYRSILGHKLATLNGEEGGVEMGIVYYRTNGKVNCSLRSNGDVDVSLLAEKYGGGGHKNAASMDFDSFSQLPFEFVDEK